MFFIFRGVVQVFVENKKENGDSEETVLATLTDGAFFGEIALIKHVKRSASCQSMTYCDILRLSREGFETVKANYEDFFDAVNELASNRQRETMWQKHSSASAKAIEEIKKSDAGNGVR